MYSKNWSVHLHFNCFVVTHNPNWENRALKIVSWGNFNWVQIVDMYVKPDPGKFKTIDERQILKLNSTNKTALCVPIWYLHFAINISFCRVIFKSYWWLQVLFEIQNSFQLWIPTGPNRTTNQILTRIQIWFFPPILLILYIRKVLL